MIAVRLMPGQSSGHRRRSCCLAWHFDSGRMLVSLLLLLFLKSAWKHVPVMRRTWSRTLSAKTVARSQKARSAAATPETARTNRDAKSLRGYLQLQLAQDRVLSVRKHACRRRRKRYRSRRTDARRG